MSASVSLAEALQAMHDMAMRLAIVEQERAEAVARAVTAETALATAQADNTRLRDGILRAMEVAPTNTYQVLHVLLASTTGANE